MKKILAFIFLINIILMAQVPFESEIDVKVKGYSSFEKAHPGNEVKYVVNIKIGEHLHINSNKPKEDYLIPTSITFEKHENVQVLKTIFPKAEEKVFPFSELPLSVYEGDVFIGTLLKVKENAESGVINIPYTVTYQACNDKNCFAPEDYIDTLTLEIVNKDQTISPINQNIINKIDMNYTENKEINNDDNDVTKVLESSGTIVAFIIIFVWGMALNLTPCVYPLIPITIGYFGGQAEGNTKKLFLMGLLFVIGMAITYSIIGVVTSLTGAIFGALLQNVFVIIAIAVIFVVLSLSMFGLYEISLPNSIVNKAGGARSGYAGAIFMGLTMGIVAAPCVGPVVLGLVTYVASKADPVYGFWVFFILALGLGLPYLLLAIFSGKLKSLPRSGEWMEAVKHIFGYILLGMALYYLLPVLPDSISGYILPVYMIIAAILLVIDKLGNRIKIFKAIKLSISIILLSSGIYFLIPENENSVKWTKVNETASLIAAGKEGTIIDFYADWCVPCKELDKFTFTDEKVIEESKNFLTLKADMTGNMTPGVEELRNKYKVTGVPTIIILDSNGKEITRVTGYIKAEEFLKILQKI